MRRVVIRDVAAAAGVSHGTVSHYLNHPEIVSAERARKIEEAIDRLGFIRNEVAGQLRRGRSKLLGFLSAEMASPPSIAVAQGIETAIEPHGLTLLMAGAGLRPHNASAYLDLLLQHRFAGVVLSVPDFVEPQLARMRDGGIPSVLMRRTEDPLQPSVAVDDHIGGVLAGSHLASLQRSHIVFLGGPVDHIIVRDRLAGLREGVSTSTPTPRVSVIDTPVRTIAGGVEAADRILKLKGASAPDAVFAVNDLVAIGVEQRLVSAGVRLPDDIAIVGFGDIDYAASSLVPLTTLSSRESERGAAAADLLMRSLAGERIECPHVLIEPRLVVRASTVGDQGGRPG